MSGDCDKCDEHTFECKDDIKLIEYHPRIQSYLAAYRYARFMKNLLHMKYIEKMEKELK
jgi:hypothetical protein